MITTKLFRRVHINRKVSSTFNKSLRDKKHVNYLTKRVIIFISLEMSEQELIEKLRSELEAARLREELLAHLNAKITLFLREDKDNTNLVTHK